MTQVQEMRIVKPTGQSAMELVETLVLAGVMYYVICPGKRDEHLAILHAKIAAVKRWLVIQDTVQSIRNLPEAPSRM